jgi:AcrR family transcriptional regulator
LTLAKPIRTNAQGDTTRTLLIAVAERLYAERGIAAVSLREIASAAGQRNNAAIQYHFGNTEGLLRAISVHRARITDTQRAAMLADAVSRPSGYEVIDLIEAMVRPLSAHLAQGDHYLAFLSRLADERGFFGSLGDDVPGAMRMIPDLIERRTPDISPRLIRHRFDIALISMVHALAHSQRLMNRDELDLPVDEVIDDLITVIAAWMLAPPQRPRRTATGDSRSAATSG